MRRPEQMGSKKLRLNARKTAEGFYKKLGYVSKRDYFLGEPYNHGEVEMVVMMGGGGHTLKRRTL